MHEDVEPAECRRRLLHGAPGRAAVREIGGDRVAARSGGGERGGRRLGVGSRAVVGERDLRSALAEPERDRAAEAARAPRHEHAGARDVHAGQPLLEREPEAADDRLDRLVEGEPGLRRDLLGAVPAPEQRPGDEVERHDLRSGHAGRPFDVAPPAPASRSTRVTGAPSAPRMTPPNAITLARMLVVPVVVWLILADFANHERWAAVAYGVAASTDSLDGYLARRRAAGRASAASSSIRWPTSCS